MKVAILGLGEAGSMYADAFLASGATVTGFDPAPRDIPGLDRKDTAADAVVGADLVLGLTTAAHAVRVAEDVAGSLPSGSVYVDLNAGSPHLKESVATTLGSAATMVDGAVIGSVKKFGARVAVLLSGPGATAAVPLLSSIGAQVEVVSDTVGDASRRKLLRSVYMKGLGALISEAMEAGERAGEVAWMRTQIAESLVDGAEALDRLNDGTLLHARRRAAELGASLALLEDYSGHWSVTRGARDRHVDLSLADPSALADALAEVPTSALGDGLDRLGYASSRLTPVWDCPPLAGRALTVLTSPGDNKAVHEALGRARPGDVLVISAGGHTERALLGELIAERALQAGIRGVVTDGAVRDVASLASLGFPVWAAGVSPAGPFKTGPGHVNVPVALGGTVCAPGDFVVADSDGVIVVPAARAEHTLAAGRAVLADEARRRDRIRAAARD